MTNFSELGQIGWDLPMGRKIGVAKEQKELYYSLNTRDECGPSKKLLPSCHQSNSESFTSQI